MGQNGQDVFSLPEAHHVKEQVLQRLSKAEDQGKLFGRKCLDVLRQPALIGSSLNNRQETRIGKIKLRVIWRELATILPDLNDRLHVVALLIQEGACSLLPTPVASDSTRSPGSESHCRLKKSRGLRLPEELGARPGPELLEWMMGYPIGWTDVKHLATLLSRKLPTKSSKP